MWPFTRKRVEQEEQHERLEQKEAVPVDFSYFVRGGNATFMQRDAKAYAKEGYAENVITFAVIHKIAQAAASVGLQLQRGEQGEMVDTHEVLDLLKRPNPTESGSDFLYAVAAWRLIAGEAFIGRLPRGQGKPATGKPSELWALEPHHMKVTRPDFGVPTSYEYRTDKGQVLAFPVNPRTGFADVLHLKTFNPLSRTRGLSPMGPAAYSIDIHNAMLKHNKALLDNGGRPSGALKLAQKDGSALTLTDDQRQQLREAVNASYTGSGNTGRPLILEAGMEWQEMGLSPKDLDFGGGSATVATNICMAYGVPPQMIGLPGSQTFANYEQAVESFWEDTVLPLLEGILDGLNRWLLPMYGEAGLMLAADKDSISALEPVRQMKYQRLDKVTFLTTDEKRAEADFDPYEASDNPAEMLFIPTSVMPLDMAGADLTPDPALTDPANPDPAVAGDPAAK